MQTAVAIVAVTTAGRALAGVLAYLRSPSLPGGFLFAITNPDGYAEWKDVPVPFAGVLELAGSAQWYGDPNNPKVGCPVSIPAAENITLRCGPSLANPQDILLPAVVPFKKPLRVPTREQVCLGRTTQQGLRITTAQFGEMPWWGACWAWLTPEDRASAAAQLLAHGDTICLIQVALKGWALYDEPNQFYSADKFPPITQTLAQTVALCQEAMDLGFDAVWLFLDGDDGNNGYPVAIEQTNALGPLLGELNQCVLQIPGWDGVFYGYDPVSKISDFAAQARAAGAIYVGLEHSTGHIPLGEGPTDFTPTGRMAGYDMILGEFDGTTHGDSTWQILARMAQPYVRPPDQPNGDDPPPVSNYLSAGSPRGPFYYRIFEYLIYQYVRGMSDADVATETAYLQTCSPEQVIC